MTMKVDVLFNDSGDVGAMSHPRPGNKGATTALGGLRPGKGQYLATVEVPDNLSHLKPRELHDAVRVDNKGGSPRLVAKTR
jgi:hypothetical protein